MKKRFILKSLINLQNKLKLIKRMKNKNYLELKLYEN